MNTYRPRAADLRTLLLRGTLLASACIVSGQTEKSEDNVLVLSPFVVSAPEDKSYVATDTLAGSRLRTSLQDVSAAISVVTEQFMADTGANDAKRLLVYTVGTEISGVGGNFSGTNLAGEFSDESSSRKDPGGSNRVRGLASADLTRDYFTTNVPFDAYNTSRVEINRGSNSILFGLGSPAGIINNATKTALYRNQHSVEVKTDSHGSVRSVVDINREIVPDHLAVRIIGLEDRQKFEQEEAFENDSRLFLAFDAKPFSSREGFLSKLTLRGNYEEGAIDANRPRITPPLDSVTPWFSPWSSDSSPKFTFDPGNKTFGQRVAWEMAPLAALLRNAAVVYPDETSAVPRDPAATAGQNIIGRQFVLSNWLFPSGTRTTAVQGGITSYGAVLRLKGNQDYVFYRQPSITDRSIFDYRKHIIEGPNKYEDSDFSAWNLTMEQMFLDNKAGIEVSVDRQELTNWNGSLIGDGRAAQIYVDTALTMIDATPNSNFGRAFIEGFPEMDTNRTEQRASRATIFYNLDLTDNGNKWLSRLIGRHVFTGVASQQSTERSARSGVFAMAGSEFTQGASTSVANAQGPRIAAIHYLGGSLAGLNSAAGANIPAISAQRSLDPANLTGNGAVFFLKGQGATDVPGVRSLNIFTNDRDLTIAPATASLNRQKVESLAFVTQSHFWNDQLIATLGWRNDKLKIYDAGAAPLHPQGSRIVDPSVYKLPSTPNYSDKSHTFSWGLALHAPQKLVDRISWLDRATLYYNDSSNFQPSGARYNVYGDRISSPQGTSVDKGIGLSLFDNKLQVRATWYKTNQENVEETTLTNLISQIVTEGYVRIINVTRLGLNPDGNGDGIPTEAGYVAPPQGLLDAFNVVRLPDGTAAFSNPGNVIGLTSFQSKGLELEIAYNPTRQLTLLLNAAQQESVKNNSGADLYKFYFEDPVGPNGQTLYANWSGPVGQSIAATEAGQVLWGLAENVIANPIRSVIAQDGAIRQELREWRVNLVGNYTFSTDGRFKGWNVGGAYRWQSEQAIGYPIIAGPAGRIIDVAKPYFGPTEQAVDAWIGYERSILNDKVDWRIQLNIRNLLDDDALVPLMAQPDGSYATYRIPEGRVWEISSRFSF